MGTILKQFHPTAILTTCSPDINFNILFILFLVFQLNVFRKMFLFLNRTSTNYCMIHPAHCMLPHFIIPTPRKMYKLRKHEIAEVSLCVPHVTYKLAACPRIYPTFQHLSAANHFYSRSTISCYPYTTIKLQLENNYVLKMNVRLWTALRWDAN